MERKDKNGERLKTGETQRPDGRYQFSKMKDKKRYTLYANTLEDLRKKEEIFLQQMAAGWLKTDPQEQTLDDYAKYWFKTYGRQGRKPSTLQLYERKYNHHLKPEIGFIPLKKLKRYDLQAAFNNLIDRGLKTSTLEVTKFCIHNILEMAVDEEIIDRNPARGLVLPKEPKVHRNALGKEQLKAFLDFLKEDDFYSFYEPFFLTLFYTGMRVGECCALTWDDIDFENRIITVNKSQVRLNNRIYIGTPKSKSSFRNIPMNDIVYQCLLNLKEKMKENLKNDKARKRSKENAGKTKSKRNKKEQTLTYISDAGRECGTVSGFLFFSTKGRVLTESTVRQIISHIANKNKEENGMEKFVPHQSRHTFTSMAYEAGIDVKYTSLILGHSSINTTMDLYTHLSEEFNINQNKAFRKLGS